MIKFAPVIVALLLGTAAPAAFAQTAPASAPPAVGAMVYDPQGGEVGKIVSVANGAAVIDTGKHKATVEIGSIGSGKAGRAIGYTRDQLNAAVEAASGQAAAALDAALVAGAEIKAQDGIVIGKVGKVSAEGVVVERPSGKPVSLPRDTLTLKDGALSLLFSSAEFEAAIGKAAAPTASSASATSPATTTPSATTSAGAPATTGR